MPYFLKKYLFQKTYKDDQDLLLKIEEDDFDILVRLMKTNFTTLYDIASFHKWLGLNDQFIFVFPYNQNYSVDTFLDQYRLNKRGRFLLYKILEDALIMDERFE